MSAKYFKLLFRLRCKLPGVQGNLVCRVWPTFAKIYASSYENSGGSNIFSRSFLAGLNKQRHLFNLLLKVNYVTLYIPKKKKRKALDPGFTYGSMERSIEPLFFFDQWPH